LNTILFFSKEDVIRKKLYFKYVLSVGNSNRFNISKSKKKIIVALAADYGNLGDVAITYAQTKFLRDNFPDHDVIDFPISRTFIDMKSLKKICTPNDIITIVGGGNTGDMYDDIEYCRQFIIQQFPRNKIISFPQTVDFSKTANGKKAMQKAIKVYSKHKNLLITAREKLSLNKYEQNFSKNKVLFLPDIVLFLNEQHPQYERKGLTLCLRSDGEKSIDKSQENTLIDQLEKNYNIQYYDTHLNKTNLSIEEREFELNKIWTAFKKSKVVVTDRLHGMIFCAITKTPCVAIDNSNKKISGVYNAWLKDLKYITILSEFDLNELQKEIEGLWNSDIETFKTVDLGEKFKGFLKTLL
jgi:pyruvyl transferase EpsI